MSALGLFRQRLRYDGSDPPDLPVDEAFDDGELRWTRFGYGLGPYEGVRVEEWAYTYDPFTQLRSAERKGTGGKSLFDPTFPESAHWAHGLRNQENSQF